MKLLMDYTCEVYCDYRIFVSINQENRSKFDLGSNLNMLALIIHGFACD